MTQNVIEELKAKYEAGTKGRWRTYSCDSFSPIYGGVDDQRVADRPSPNIMWPADAALIVAMHTHLPVLLAVVEAARAYSSQAPDIDMRDARDQLHRALSTLTQKDGGSDGEA